MNENVSSRKLVTTVPSRATGGGCGGGSGGFGGRSASASEG